MSIFRRKPKIVLYEHRSMALPDLDALERAGYTPIGVCGDPRTSVRFPGEKPPAVMVPCNACDGTGKRLCPAFNAQGIGAEVMAMLAQGICVACRGRGFQIVEAEE